MLIKLSSLSGTEVAPDCCQLQLQGGLVSLSSSLCTRAMTSVTRLCLGLAHTLAAQGRAQGLRVAGGSIGGSIGGSARVCSKLCSCLIGTEVIVEIA